jgi:hypothetical protein
MCHHTIFANGFGGTLPKGEKTFLKLDLVPSSPGKKKKKRGI